MEKEINTNEKIVIGGVYRHFKGEYCKVLTVGLDTDTLEELVVYIALCYKPEKETRVWIRSLKEFMGTKEMEDGSVIKRFEFVSER